MTETEAFWSGPFGDAYNVRSPGSVASNIAFFSKALSRTRAINAVVEYGAGVGNNLRAIRALLPDAHLVGVEINRDAAMQCESAADAVVCGSAHDVVLADEFDLAFTKGFLIHVALEALPAMYDKLAGDSVSYVLIAEYFNPTPVEIPYRGHNGRLWKRNFGGEFLKRHEDFYLLSYGFVGQCDEWPQDDLNFWLMERA